MKRWSTEEGTPRPFGVHLVPEDQAYNFSLYSKHATSVTLHLYAESDAANPIYTYRFDHLKNKTGRIWHCRVPAAIVEQGRYYAYQVDGPSDPAEGTGSPRARSCWIHTRAPCTSRSISAARPRSVRGPTSARLRWVSCHPTSGASTGAGSQDPITSTTPSSTSCTSRDSLRVPTPGLHPKNEERSQG